MVQILKKRFKIMQFCDGTSTVVLKHSVIAINNFRNVTTLLVFWTVLKNFYSRFTCSVNLHCMGVLSIYYSEPSKILLMFTKLKVWKILLIWILDPIVHRSELGI